MSTALSLGGMRAELYASGVTWLPEPRLLCVADIHFEKGTFFQPFGTLLPPYDTRATLIRLAEIIAVFQPRIVVALGDSFHDTKAVMRMHAEDRKALDGLIASVEQWVWVEGNHDPVIAPGLAGTRCREYSHEHIVFRHKLEPESQAWEMSGHYHPKTKLSVKGHSISTPCFVRSEKRLILPAFGEYTGGLNVRDPQFIQALSGREYAVYLGGN